MTELSEVPVNETGAGASKAPQAAPKPPEIAEKSEGKVEDPIVLQETIQGFKDDPEWSSNARGALEEVGLSFDDLAGKDLTSLPKDEFARIAGKLAVLSQEGYRVMPPPPSS